MLTRETRKCSCFCSRMRASHGRPCREGESFAFGLPRRIQRLEEAGYVTRRIVVPRPGKDGRADHGFCADQTAHHSDDWIEKFRRAISDIPEIVEAQPADRQLRLHRQGVSAAGRTLRRRLQADRAEGGAFDVSASISMEVPEKWYRSARRLCGVGPAKLREDHSRMQCSHAGRRTCASRCGVQQCCQLDVSG